MALEDDIAAMNRNRVQRGLCQSVDDLAQQVQTYQNYLTNIVNEFDEQITNITEGTAVKVIRGQATAAVTGSNFQIDNIVSLTDGFSAPSEPLDVVNVIGFSCPEDHVVYAILNPGATEWEGFTVPPAEPEVLIIGGLTTGSVADSDPTFTIDTIVSFSSGYTHATSPQTVVNTFGRALGNNQPVYAIYRPDNDTWETWVDTDTTGGGGGSYSAGFGLELATSTFSVDNNGYAGSGDEIFGAKSGTVQWDTVEGWLQELPGHGNDKVLTTDSSGVVEWADPSGSGETLFAYTDTSISPASGSFGAGLTPGSATVSVMEWDGSKWVDSGTNLTARNVTPSSISSNRFVVIALIDGIWTIIMVVC